MINYFLNRSTDTSADLNYIAVKFLVYLSETAEFQHTVALKGSTDGNFKMFIDTIVGFSHKTEIIQRNDYRCIKEGIRYLINLSMMRNETDADIVAGLCSMSKACIRSNNANNVALAFLGLKLVSQNERNHQLILREQNLFEYILRLEESIVQANSKIITIFCFNMLINEDVQKTILDKNILQLVNKLVLYSDEVGASQIQAIVIGLIQAGHIDDLLKYNIEDVILHLLRPDKPAIINSVYQTFYVIASLTLVVSKRENQSILRSRYNYRDNHEVP